ncbi:MAG: DnaJ domain-containing protein [Gammaproteobacteria bacterium]|nr:DnaJ domain-containing protein [Gammaproteobacteria bacterium]
MKETIKDHYAFLGVSRRASAKEIKMAYHKKAREYHPDVSNRCDADEMFSQLNKAYSVLKDKKKRAEYNLELMADIFQEQVVDPAKQRCTRYGYSSAISDDDWGLRVG